MARLQGQDLQYPVHQEPHPQAGQLVDVTSGSLAGKQIQIEDWFDRVMAPWGGAGEGHPASVMFSLRVQMEGLPWDHETVYGHIGGAGQILHVCELGWVADENHKWSPPE